MKTEYLSAIVSIYNQKSILRASKEMGISEWSLKKYIDIIEEEIGKSIIYENDKGVELTYEGYSLYLYADKYLNDLKEFKLSHSLKKDMPEFQIAVDTNMFSGYLVRCSQFIKERTNVRFDIVQLYRELVIYGVNNRKFDLGLIIIDEEIKSKIEEIQLQLKVLQSTRYVVILSESHPLSTKDRVSIEELRKYKRICIDYPFEDYYSLDYKLEHSFNLNNKNIIFTCIEDILLLVRDSEYYFITWLNEDEEGRMKGVKAIEIEELENKAEVAYIYRKNEELPKVLEDILLTGLVLE